MQKPNLLPPAYRPQPLLSISRLTRALVVVLLIFFGVLSYAKLLWEVEILEQQSQHLTSALSQLRPLQDRLRELEALEKEVANLQDFSKKAKETTEPWSQYLTELAKLLPEGASFITINSNNEGNIYLKGKTNNQMLVPRYAMVLRELAWVESVEIVNIVLEEKGPITFELILSLKSKGGEG